MSEQKRLLICDDDLQILRALRVLLSDKGFRVISATTAAEALDFAALHSPHLAIIDLLLPDGDGVEVCRRLREWSDMPILVLSGIGEEPTKVRALEAGADDYVTKPFGPGELVSRLRAISRRVDPEPDDPLVVVDGLEVDFVGRTVRQEGREVRLTPIEYDLLRVLLRNRGRLLTHKALLSEVWGPNCEPYKQSLQRHVSNLRRKIDPHPQRRRYIRTDFGVGYRFVG